jgi:hypothetical protein
MKYFILLMVALVPVLNGCKWTGDTIENKSGNDVDVVLTDSNGEIHRTRLPNGRLFALASKNINKMRRYLIRVEVIDKQGSRIGVFDAENRANKTKHIHLVVLADRIDVSD